ncbi:MAG: HD domain-containing protein [Candidatus Micrarchaeota archaeon]|nr:HD domain-containing protein [Candidatus Micrarchaeota archaeon]
MDAIGIVENINTIYDRFEIPPNLRLHMYRVATVGEMICDSWKNGGMSIDKEEILAACLTHDLGNIAKMDMDGDGSLSMLGGEAANVGHWRSVRRRIMDRYGNTPEEATHNMAVELGIDTRILFLIENGGGGPLLLTDKIIKTGDWSLKILSYGDCRVTPFGITSARERIEDLLNRYGSGPLDFFKQVDEVEGQIFANTGIGPQDINDRSAAHYIKRYSES